MRLNPHQYRSARHLLGVLLVMVVTLPPNASEASDAWLGVEVKALLGLGAGFLDVSDAQGNHDGGAGVLGGGDLGLVFHFGEGVHLGLEGRFAYHDFQKADAGILGLPMDVGITMGSAGVKLGIGFGGHLTGFFWAHVAGAWVVTDISPEFPSYEDYEWNGLGVQGGFELQYEYALGESQTHLLLGGQLHWTHLGLDKVAPPAVSHYVNGGSADVLGVGVSAGVRFDFGE